MGTSDAAVVISDPSRKALPAVKRQHRSPELKLQIVQETLAPGASVARVARARDGPRRERVDEHPLFLLAAVILAQGEKTASGPDEEEAPKDQGTPPAVWFAYSPDRKGEHPTQHLRDFHGVFEADAYAGFNHLCEDGRIQEAACWAHVRRKFYDLELAHQSPVAQEALGRIGALYAIESEIRGRPPVSGARCGKRERGRSWNRSGRGSKAAWRSSRGSRTRRRR
jgi:hypothetical protein